MNLSKTTLKFALVSVFLAAPLLFSGCDELKSAHKSQQFANSIKKQINSDEFKYSQFITYYYLNPQSSELIPHLQYFLNKDDWVENREYQSIEIHFYAAAINHSRNKTQLLDELYKLDSQYSGAKQQIIKSIIGESNNFISPQATSDTNFDLLWIEFMATGEDLPVKKIAGFLKTTNDKDNYNIILLGAAEWSLASNATQHHKVYVILQELASSSQGIMKKRLQKILSDPRGVATSLDKTSIKPHDFENFKKLVW